MKEDQDYQTPSYLETVQSQLPALQLLEQMGWKYLTPEECNELRGNRLGNSILDTILVDFIREKGRYEYKGKEHVFTENAIANAVQKLKEFRPTGAIHQNEEVYNLLCLGTVEKQTIEGDTKSFSMSYIDWKNPQNNKFHCTAEYSLDRVGITGDEKKYRPDIILFVNGIPLGVIECKRSAYNDVNRDPVGEGIDQLLSYQRKDGIPQLFLYSQILISLARDKAKYATTATQVKFWAHWREDGITEDVQKLIAEPLKEESKILEKPFEEDSESFLQFHESNREANEQDKLLYSLCRPERFLKLIYNYIVYDEGIKKIARYQQLFTIEGILKRILKGGDSEPREGGVVWHTQGSGKSITMVMLAKSLALTPEILTPKVILVTDRIDLDDQILGTFRSCGLEPRQAKTGEELASLLSDDKAHIVTTVINKFEAASKNRKIKKVSHDTFVLVDEGHRSNYSERHARMKIALEGACFIAFTGTPLAKEKGKNTFAKFGALFEPPYTIARAVEDGTVTPLIYEARHVPQKIDKESIDAWFDKLTFGLNENEKVEVKKKFSAKKMLNKAEQKVRMIAWDVSMHYSQNYQETGMKAQLVAPDKATAILYKKCLDEFGIVKSEVLISGPGTPEGEESGKEIKKEVSDFWDLMMDRYGSEDKYNKQLINSFKKGEELEIIIVVQKLLTGFDAPCNAVLYLARILRGHDLLQAIARVNRLYEGKEYGLIMDYSGVIEELDKAIDFYSRLADYNQQDLVGTVQLVSEETSKLAQFHSDLWDLFPKLKGTVDPEPFAELMRDQESRDLFQVRFNNFAKCLSLSLSTMDFISDTDGQQIERYKKDLKFFQGLRAEIGQRYQVKLDVSEYEKKIKKLIDVHVGADEVVRLCEPINLLNEKERKDVLDDGSRSARAKADTIASATQKYIEKEMGKDPAFYSKFSDMLKDVINALHEKRIKDIEALDQVNDISNKVVMKTGDGIPEKLINKNMARRYYGVINAELEKFEVSEDVVSDIALEIDEKISQHMVRDFRNNVDALNSMRNEIDDTLFDANEKHSIDLPLEVQDTIIDKCVDITIANEE